MKQLETLLERYAIGYEKHHLQQVLTHNSFSEKNNSRYVFLGQFAFKGKVAEWIFKNTAGNGMQLQHFLGNIFKQSFLDTFFDKYIRTIQRIANKDDVAKQKHIFSYAFFGFVYENATEKQLQDFIFQLIILPNNHLLPQNYKLKNHWDQLIFLCKQHFDTKPKLVITEAEEKIQHISVLLNTEVIGFHQSISFKYAKKQAIAKALKTVADRLEAVVKNEVTYIENEKNKQLEIAQKQQLAKEAKQAIHEAKNKDHAERMKVKRSEAAQKAKETDRRRREAKQNAKEKTNRKGANTIYRAYSADEIKAMSVAKRRNLQDRGIIPKGI